MKNETTFQYTYSATQNQEVLCIRSSYLPREETKLEELVRLDNMVQSSGTTEALCAGIGGSLIFGFGIHLSIQMIGNFVWLGMLLGLLGVAGMLTAYPIRRKKREAAKEKHASRILELAAELNNQIR